MSTATLDAPALRVCIKCGIPKRIAEFRANRNACRECVREYDRDYGRRWRLRQKDDRIAEIPAITEPVPPTVYYDPMGGRWWVDVVYRRDGVEFFSIWRKVPGITGAMTCGEMVSRYDIDSSSRDAVQAALDRFARTQRGWKMTKPATSNVIHNL